MSGCEDEITAWFAGQSSLCAAQFPIGIGDDMAAVRLGAGGMVLITTDMLLDGVHFELAKVGLKQAGYKAMAVSLSDCAAMATVPVAAVVSVGLPEGFGSEELKELHAGIVSAGKKYGCALIGGDITSWKGAGGFVISVATLSKPAENAPVRRDGAKAGDAVCVTGTLGGADGGKHMVFEPRVFEAMKIAGLVKLNAMMDISDGLSSDLARICRQSNVGAIVDAERIPLSEEAKKKKTPLEAGLNDGEDFELLFTLSQEQWVRLKELWDGDLAITKIGIITSSDKLQIRNAAGQISDLEVKGYEHLGK